MNQRYIIEPDPWGKPGAEEHRVTDTRTGRPITTRNRLDCCQGVLRSIAWQEQREREIAERVARQLPLFAENGGD